MIAPFFMIAHAMAGWLDYPQDGFSFPYMLLANFATMCYVVAGLWVLGLFLIKLFTENIVALCLLTIALATNLYFFSIYLCPMSHGYLFFWYSCLLYSTHHWYKKPKIKYALLIGLSCGFIAIIRPTDVVVVLIPILYGVGSLKEFQEKIILIKNNFSHFAVAAFAFVIPIIPQIVYWKSISGNWLFYSYGDEGFDFLRPHIWGGFFSFTNGWLVYTPVMAFSLVGFVFLRKNKEWWLSIISFFLLHIYIIYSWWCWFYINGMGSRPMVQVYAVLSIPLGYSFVFLLKNKWTKKLLLVLLLFFAGLNIFQTWQVSEGILWSSVGSKGFYVETFGKTKMTKEAVISFDTRRTQPNPKKLDLVKLLYTDNFEDSLNANYNSRFAHQGKYGFALEGGTEESPGYQTTLKAAGIRTGDWLRFSAWCRSEKKEGNWYRMNLMIVEFRNSKKIVRQTKVRIENKIASDEPSLWGGKVHQWGEVNFFARVPERVKEEDLIRVYVWHDATYVPVYIDDIKVELFRKK